MDKTIVICGPTGTGKTSLALNLCKAFNGEIISADSRQIYKYMDIGTGKLPLYKTPIETERQEGVWKVLGIPIYMYDVVSPAKTYSVYDYFKKASNELASIQRRQKVPFIVGGTGFYIDILTGKRGTANVPPNIRLRSELEGKSLEELQDILKTLDRQKYNSIDNKNRIRIIRAIEILKSDQGASRSASNSRPLNTLSIGLSAPRNYLYEAANFWAEKITEKGLILETKNLLDLGFRETIPMKSLIYSSVVDFLEQKINMEEMKQKIKFDIHGYIRRQLTWFNRDPEIKWFNIADKSFDIEVLKTVQLFLDGKQ